MRIFPCLHNSCSSVYYSDPTDHTNHTNHLCFIMSPPLTIKGSDAELKALGPRIRQSVPTGYHVPFDTAKIFVKPEAAEPKISRVPLPKNMQAPPELVNSNSSMTMSSSTLSCWEEEINRPETRHMQTLNETAAVVDKKGVKHSLDEFEIVDYDHPRVSELDDYQAKYGELKFQEGF